MTVTDRAKISCTSSDKKILSVKKTTPWKYQSNAYSPQKFSGKTNAAFALIPHKKGTVTITVRYPKGKYKRRVRVEPSAVYQKVKKQMKAINNSGLDNAHKALLIAGYQSKMMEYSGDGVNQWHTLYEDIIDGEGVCDDYVRCFDYLCHLANIRSRYVLASEKANHAFNQVYVKKMV